MVLREKIYFCLFIHSLWDWGTDRGPLYRRDKRDTNLRSPSRSLVSDISKGVRLSETFNGVPFKMKLEWLFDHQCFSVVIYLGVLWKVRNWTNWRRIVYYNKLWRKKIFVRKRRNHIVVKKQKKKQKEDKEDSNS